MHSCESYRNNVKNFIMIITTLYFFFAVFTTLEVAEFLSDPVLGLPFRANPTLASAAISTLYCFSVLPVKSMHKQAETVYCGSFVGMMALFLTQTNWLESSHAGLDWDFFIFAGCTSIFYMLFKIGDGHFYGHIAKGYGGRLGTTAFIVCLCFYLIFHGVNFPLEFDRYPLAVHFKFIGKYAIGSLVGCALTLYLRRIFLYRFHDMNLVFSSALASFLIAAPTLLDAYPVAIAAAAYSGSFIAMTSEDVLDNGKILMGLSIINALTIWLYAIIFTGIGGIAGFAALTTLSVYFLIRFVIPHIIDITK